LEGGHTLVEFLEEFPSVTREAAIAALEHAKELVIAKRDEALDRRVLARTLKRLLGDHECRTVQEMGGLEKRMVCCCHWAELEFDVLVTVDQSIEYEQTLRIAGWQCSCSLRDPNQIEDLSHHPSRSCRAPQHPSWARDSVGQNESLTLLQ